MSEERPAERENRSRESDPFVEAFERALTPALVADLAGTQARVIRANGALRRLADRPVVAEVPVADIIEGFVCDGESGAIVDAVVVRPTGQRIAVTLRTDVLPFPGGSALVQLSPHGGADLHAERALWESEQRLEAIADAVDALIYLKGIDGRYLLINSFFEREHGVRREDVTGLTDVDIFGEELGRTYSYNDRRVWEAGHSMQFEELLPDGEIYLSTKFPLRRKNGELYAVGGISTDITVRSRAERAIRAAKDEAERANLAMSEFLSRMSHELRTPLNSILGFGQLLQLELAGDVEVSEKADRIVQAGRHLLKLINEVLDISRIEDHGQDLSIEPVGAVEAFQEALVLVRPLAQARHIELARDFHDGLHTVVLANPQRLTQVLLNILSNAVKYNRECGMVTASFSGPLDGRIKFLVTDTGPGLAPADLERIFTPFERLDADGTGVEGTGLGLTLSRSIATAMGGTVGVERTKKGRGSVFYVELPAIEDSLAGDMPTQTSADSDAVQLHSVLRNVRALYIEDDPANIELVQQVLRRRALADLVCVPTGGAGIEFARQSRPDVILLDMHLPDMEGEQVLAELKSDDRTRRIPVIVVSADALPARIDRLLDAGATAYLTKPIDVYNLVETVRAAVDGVIS
ncbi:PAS domain S-box-containing protein [Rhodococcus sp. OAS809]|uniref:ATP-binding response regulator n=1 Tax=Rhodococcus sp. OAS809 TaxID=2663874 RepID=UPI0017891853